METRTRRGGCDRGTGQCRHRSDRGERACGCLRHSRPRRTGTAQADRPHGGGSRSAAGGWYRRRFHRCWPANLRPHRKGSDAGGKQTILQADSASRGCADSHVSTVSFCCRCQRVCQRTRGHACGGEGGWAGRRQGGVCVSGSRECPRGHRLARQRSAVRDCREGNSHRGTLGRH